MKSVSGYQNGINMVIISRIEEEFLDVKLRNINLLRATNPWLTNWDIQLFRKRASVHKGTTDIGHNIKKEIF